MEKFNFLFSSALRYALPIFAIFIILTCVISLFRNRPRLHKLAQLINIKTNEVIDIDRWETSIGKSKSNDVVISDESISRFHAVIAKKQNEWVITDTFSKTGILINNEKIDGKCVIEDGDTISIGTSLFRFSCAEALSRDTKSKIRKDIYRETQNSNIAYAVLVDVITHRPIYLKKIDVLIGRSDDCDIQISLDTVSQHHARIHRTSKGFALTDLNSHNGTKLNGRFINQPQLIFDNDMITFGERVFIFYEK